MEELQIEDLVKSTSLKKVHLKNHTFTTLKISPNILYEHISSMLLDKENLFYYCTQKKSTDSLINTKKYIKKLIKDKIIKIEVDKILTSMGWTDSEIDITNTVFQGDLAEYLMNIIIEKMQIASTLISKVSLKTSPKMPAYGNDNIYYDYNQNILYYGESKFYSSTENAILSAFKSIELHKKMILSSHIYATIHHHLLLKMVNF